MDEIIVKTKDIKLLLSKFYVSKRMVPDRRHSNIFIIKEKFFFNIISRVFENMK